MMYGQTGEPPNKSDDYQTGKVAEGKAAIHRLIIVAMSPRPSSNHAVRACCTCVAAGLAWYQRTPSTPGERALRDQVIRQRGSLNRCFGLAHICWPSPSIQYGRGPD
jgi:hypothetical protein